MEPSQVERIHIAPDSGDPMRERQDAAAVAGRGLRSDRYFEECGLWNALGEAPDRAGEGASDLTFIEAEALAAVERSPSVMRSVWASNCANRVDTCSHSSGNHGLSDALVHCGGLNTRVVESGRVAVGGEIRW